MKVVIIGGVAGGATVAARLRRLDENAEIVIIERTGFVSYANCGLPYYIGGAIADQSALTLQTPESFMHRFRIDVRVRNEAIAIDRNKKSVQVKRLDDGSVYAESYDELILSPGATALRPDVPGIDDAHIVTLRTVEDTLAIRQTVDDRTPSRAVIVGGGFIGIEMAENLISRGIPTTLLQRSAQVLPFIDYDMACQVHAYLRDKGLDVRLNTPISSYEPLDQADGVRINLDDGTSIEAELVVLAVGVVPDTHLAREAGLELGMKGSIVTDAHMRTSDPHIYAVGDAVQVHQFVSGADALIPLAGPANKQGRIAADNICGLDSTFSGSLGSSIVKLFDMTIAATGINEKTAQKAGIDYETVVTFSPSHATYYPGATSMTIKTLFSPETGRILGAQAIGFDGVDKRIDVIATAIHANMTGADLAQLDLAYAPPFSSAKDPVNMAGFVIENICDGIVKQFGWRDLEELPHDGSVTFLDVRSASEFSGGGFPGAVNIPLDTLRDHLDQLDVAKPVYVNCYSGLRSYIACRILTQHGFDCYNFVGGYRFFEHIEKERSFDKASRHACGVEIHR